MKILITSGGTTEYIDEVRVLTNISTGKLGAKIAESFQREEHLVYYVHAKGAAMPDAYSSEDHYIIQKYEIRDVASLVETMRELVPKVDVVIHCMAVSDFGFEPAKTKLKSNDPLAFVDSLRDRIKVNPKVLSMIKKWNQNCFLISFKFEVGLENSELIRIAKESMDKNNCDIVVANDKKEMVEKGKHIAYVIKKNGDTVVAESKENIASILVKVVEDNVRVGH